MDSSLWSSKHWNITFKVEQQNLSKFLWKDRHVNVEFSNANFQRSEHHKIYPIHLNCIGVETVKYQGQIHLKPAQIKSKPSAWQVTTKGFFFP